jgi:tetratricopeptide (TPR) repeat protein
MSETTNTLLQQGLFHHRQGQIELAMARYMEVLRKNPQNAEALYYCAVVACQGRQFQEGIDLARRALACGKDDGRVYNLIGQAQQNLGDKLAAIKNFDEALRRDPNLAEAHGNRASILAEAGYPQEALKAYDRAVALKPDSLADWVNRGCLLRAMGRETEALDSFDKATGLAPDDIAVLSNRGFVLAALGRYEEALAALDRVVARRPGLAPAHKARGGVFAALGREEEAKASFAIAEEIEARTAKDDGGVAPSQSVHKYS